MSAGQDAKAKSLHLERDAKVTQRLGVNERNLCILYGDHDECPINEVDSNGVYITCNCSCHLFPGSPLE